MYARYSLFRTRLDNPNYANSPAVPSDNGGLMDTLNGAADAVYTMGPTTVLNVRFGVSYLEDDYDSEWAKWGEAGLQKFWANNPWYKPYIEGIPAIYYPNFSIGNAGFGKSSTWFYRPRKYNVQATLAKDRGRHYLKWGMSQRHSYGTNVNPNLMNFSFGPAHTASTFISPNTRLNGDAWATFLLGVIDGSSGARRKTPQNIIREQWGVFFQDDLKLTRRITLNLGIRYEYETAPIEEKDRMSRYLDLTDPISEMQKNPPKIPAEIAAMNTVPYKFTGAWVFTDSEHRGLYRAPKNTILPRAGIALRLNDKTALRIGYARYAIPMLNVIGTSWYINADGYNVSSTALGPQEGIPRAVLSDPYPASSNPLILPAGKQYGRYTNLGDGASWMQQNLKVGINDRINLTLQRELPTGIRADVTYFVNLGHNVPTSGIWGGSGFRYELNSSDPALSYKYKAELARRITNPFYLYMTAETFPGPLRNQPTITVGTLLKPYPHYGGLGETMGDGIGNRYHALQVKLERAFAKGYSFVAGYNFNREWTQDYFNSDDRYADRLTWIGSNNSRHRLSAAWSVDFPVGRGRRRLSNAHPVLNAILGGWSTSHIYMWNSGTFLRFGQLELSGNPTLKNPTRDKWFDTSVFAIAIPYTPRVNPMQYEGLTGPGYWNLDSTLSKHFSLSERYRLEFRFEAYNLSNSFMLGGPNTSVTSSLFGRSTAQANYGREMQYTMRLHF